MIPALDVNKAATGYRARTVHSPRILFVSPYWLEANTKKKVVGLIRMIRVPLGGMGYIVIRFARFSFLVLIFWYIARMTGNKYRNLRGLLSFGGPKICFPGG